MKIAKIICVLFSLSYSLGLYADEDVERNIQQSLAKILPDVEITRISKTPIDNLYEVLVATDVIYMTGDGRYVLKGDLLDMQKRLNLSEELRSTARTKLFNTLSADEIIEFAPKKTDHVIYVFTDIDCAYCRRLHRDVPVLNENGVSIRYLAYPRAGIGSRAFNDMQAVWCAEDRKQALTDAKNGKQVIPKECDNPVEAQYKLGKALGIRGTPAIFLEDGEEIPGYMPPAELLKYVKK
jgi:thiol:disulfide interchange protein DsbC